MLRNRALIKYFCVSFLCALAVTIMTSSVTFASTMQPAAPSKATVVPGGAPTAVVSVYINHRKVHVYNASCTTPRPDCPVPANDYINAGQYQAYCQAQSAVAVSDLGYTNNWWTLLQIPGGDAGWVTNIYIKGAAELVGVPRCSSAVLSPSSQSTQPKPAESAAESTKKVLVYKATNLYPCITQKIVGHRTQTCKSIAPIPVENYSAVCQKEGRKVTTSAGMLKNISNTWWTHIETKHGKGWISNVFIRGGEKVAGLRDCLSSGTYDPSKHGTMYI